eukprot:scaffold5602_cov30-Phaeocystis_antarctica.AAC.1
MAADSVIGSRSTRLSCGGRAANHLGDGCPSRHTEALARLGDEFIDREVNPLRREVAQDNDEQGDDEQEKRGRSSDWPRGRERAEGARHDRRGWRRSRR